MASAQGCHGLFSLPHLPAKRINRKKTLVNYFQSHVVTLEEYLRIMQQKTMEAAERIQESNRKERQEKQTRKTLTLLTVIEKLA